MVTIKCRTKKIGYILIILLPVAGLALSCGASSEPQVALPASPFKIAELAINPAEVNPGVQVIITAKVTNTGNTGDDYIAEVRIDDVTKASLPAFFYSEKVTIAAGASQLVIIVASRDTPGIYKVTLGELTGELVVVKPEEPTPAPTPPKTSATFETTQLAINPAEVNPGVKIVISAGVTNTGGSEAIYTAQLRIDDVMVATAKATIAAGASQVVGFAGAVYELGTHKVSWVEVVGGQEIPRLTGEFVILKPEETITASPTIAPDFTGVDVVTNKTISLSQFKGAIILLSLVNYGCDQSTNRVVSAQLLAIKELTKQRSDFVPLSVFCGCCPLDVLRRFAIENALSWPWLLDTGNAIVRQYASYLRKYGYPTLIFIDKDQYIRGVTGYSDVSTLSAKIDQLLPKR